MTFNEGAFDATGNTRSYTLTVTSATNSITFSATALNQFASIRMQSYGPSVQNLVASNVPLVNGANVFVFNCTAQNANFFTTYTVTVTRTPSSDTNLLSLTAAPYTVLNNSNAFTINVVATASSVTLVATAAWQFSQVSINNAPFGTCVRVARVVACVECGTDSRLMLSSVDLVFDAGQRPGVRFERHLRPGAC